MITYCL